MQEVEQEDYKTNQSAPVTTPICQKPPEMETLPVRCDTKCGILREQIFSYYYLDFLYLHHLLYIIYVLLSFAARVSLAKWQTA